jgi:hypothetical protein
MMGMLATMASHAFTLDPANDSTRSDLPRCRERNWFRTTSLLMFLQLATRGYLLFKTATY